MGQVYLNEAAKRSVVQVGFEPTPPKRLELESSALDHSAIQPVCGEERPGSAALAKRRLRRQRTYRRPTPNTKTRKESALRRVYWKTV